MIRSLAAPIKILTENTFRSMAYAKSASGSPVGMHLQSKATRDTRATIAMLLTQLPKPRPTLEDGSANKYVVRLTRISPGYTDDDGLAGGTMKAVRDAVAEWVGVDDGRRDLIRFEYDQMSCPRSKFALRIEVEDQAPGEPVRLELGDLPATIREARPRGSEKLPKRAPAPMQQGALVFRKSWALCPWEQDGGEPVLTPLAMTGHDPPRRIRMHVPAVILSGAASVRYRPGSSVELERHEYEVEGRSAYVYMTQETEERP